MKTIKSLILGALLMGATSAHALSLDYNTVISGAIPDGTLPWLTATFSDVTQKVNGVNTNGVLMVLRAPGLTGSSDFVTEWDFNSKLSTLAGLQHVDTLTGTQLKSFAAGSDIVHGGTGALFDMDFIFCSSASQSKRFDGGDIASVFLYGVNGLTADSFNAYSDPIDKAYLSEAHIQGITNLTGSSTWVIPGEDNGSGGGGGTPVVPEPGTALLLGAGMAGLALYRRTRK
ncbi:PEP-CTERM sorting domain-containing protein [Geomesophilobacter sediminis]|uniref:PEP-CTERM sorting domain-containing protein n=1 Tax=Geomesophilobacter sediminis TaxID=2798584 RepID=UPI001F3BB6E5|nr:PEP-CTERM sorting domain-containing protein [Geomesophilobacter sediminis]